MSARLADAPLPESSAMPEPASRCKTPFFAAALTETPAPLVVAACPILDWSAIIVSDRFSSGPARTSS